MQEESCEIVELLASPVHRYEGRPIDGPAPAPDGELVNEIHIRAGLGIVGDRYFGHRAHRDAAITRTLRRTCANPAPGGSDSAAIRVMAASR